MLYHLFEWFKEQEINFPGSGILGFISFRVLLAMLLSLIITLVFGKRLINVIKKRLGDETVRDLGLAGEQQKKGTPTMGGVIIILGIVIPTLLFARLDTIYIILVAGKGHEKYQEIKGVRNHFDDKEVVREMFEMLNR